MKKIVFIVPIYSPAKLSGSEVYVKSIAEALAQQNIKVTIITSNALKSDYWYNPFSKKTKSETEYINGVKVIRLKVSHCESILFYILNRYFYKFLHSKTRDYLSMMSFGPILKNIESAILDEEPDIIHCSPIPMTICFQLYEIRSKIKKNIKTIYTPFTHIDLSSFKNSFISQILRSSSTVHAVTETEKKYLVDKFKVKNKNIIVVPLYIDEKNKYDSSTVNEDIKKIFKKENKYVLFAGNKGFYKGAVSTYKSMELLAQKHPNIKLISIGNSTSEWNKITAKHPNFLYDLPYISDNDKEYIFSKSDLFCMPSISDSFGLVYLEAWKYSKPVISADTNVMHDVLKNGSKYVKFNSVLDIADAIEQLLYKKIQEKNMLGKTGNLILKRIYSKEKVIKQYIDLFNL